MSNATLQQRQSVPINFGLEVLPLEGSRAIGVNFDFSLGPVAALNTQVSDIGMSMVQTMYIDNRNNLSSVSFQIGGSNQFVNCPPQTQGFFPILLMGKASLNIIGTSAGGVLVPVQLINTYVDPMLWNAFNPTVTGSVTVNGTVVIQPLTAAYTDYSGTIAAANVSQQVAPANGVRKRFVIQNPSTAALQGIAAAESLFVNFTSAASLAGGSEEIQPGGSFDTGTGPVTTEIINIVAATAGHKFTAKGM